jgi:predicted acylesterase/phospholipase RssA
MQEFEAHGHTIGRLLGTSAGAITATLLAAGYTSAEMLAALDEHLPDGNSVFTSFMAMPGPFDPQTVKNSTIRAFLRSVDIPLMPQFLEDRLDDAITNILADTGDFRHMFSFVERGGWYSADNFLHWLHTRLDTGVYNGKPRNFGDMTMSQYFDATQKDLSLVASDTTGKQMLVLNHLTAPDLPVIWATRMSMSIPLLWQEVIWQAEWGLYNDQKVAGNAIVDGGLLSNFPIELFLSDLKDVTDLMGEKISQNVLGFLIDDETELPDAPQAVADTRTFNITDIPTAQRITRLIDTTLSARDKMVIDSYSNLVVRMPAKGYGTTEFNMTDERRTRLVNAGRLALKTYFNATPAPTTDPVSFGLEPEDAPDHDRIDRVAAKILRKKRP